jgi:TatD DNase family protein
VQICDTHCHLNLNNFRDDVEEVIQRARLAGVSRILVPGIDLSTNQIALELAKCFPEVHVAVGIHPNDGLTWTDETLPQLRQLASHPKVVAIGEIGLDYYRDRCPREMQQTIFKAQLLLATETNLPVVIHNRDAFQDLWPILSDWQQKLHTNRSPLARQPGVLHSFTGNLSEAMMIVHQSFFIGISGPVTFKNAMDRQEVATGVPEGFLLLETDAPFLTPHPHRGERNEPAFVQFINSKIAALRGISSEQMAETTTYNADRLFLWRSSLV